jgi:hypothetical protein
MKLNVKSFALTCGIFLGFGTLLVTWFLLLRGAPGEIMSKFADFYIGYSFTYGGAVLGLVWGFVYGFVLGGIFSWVYNKFISTKKSD